MLATFPASRNSSGISFKLAALAAIPVPQRLQAPCRSSALQRRLPARPEGHLVKSNGWRIFSFGNAINVAIETAANGVLERITARMAELHVPQETV